MTDDRRHLPDRRSDPRETPDRRSRPLKSKLRCPICEQQTVSRVLSSRVGTRHYWRQRKCFGCGETYTTKEVVAALNRPTVRSPRNI